MKLCSKDAKMPVDCKREYSSKFITSGAIFLCCGVFQLGINIFATPNRVKYKILFLILHDLFLRITGVNLVVIVVVHNMTILSSANKLLENAES
jgi:hypothetical protein